MARRHKLWAKRERERLFSILGRHCTACGATDRLTFDCIEPMGDTHHRGNAPARICFYRRQMQAGNVQVLCEHCNALKNDLDAWTWRSACCKLRAAEAVLRLARSPCRGLAFKPEERIEFIRNCLSEMRQDNAPF